MHRIRRGFALFGACAVLLGLSGASNDVPELTRPPSPDAAPALWQGVAVRTVGKLVLDLGDGQYGVCSGAIVDSPSGSVVATAAHCLTSPDSPKPPPRGWFAPGYDRVGPQRAVATGWRIVSYHTPRGWNVRRNLAEILPHDYAFVTVERRGGRTIAETYGANRLAFAPIDVSRAVTPLGYPVAPEDGAGPLSTCHGTAEVLTAETAHEANVGGLLLRACGLTQGTSGGPWLQDFDPVTEAGTVVGVMSVGSGDGEVLARPYPAGAGRALLDRADRAAAHVPSST
ncbi:trypsin-like serine peptidase [Streptomyces alkaliterrae]|uniref:Trypsin-like serine protease n=1 Tax=Streptomyces alkaliterrae TaxID=2213162 RepID=A0A5P0YSQ4_9ACTN|nr:trypsin-like peptidase domain-containing protein [Streptomyces alkaliterrae]MBB1254581.1 hypothetical protein [Streptomyces alkaliterrae]MBB1259423.1 hypothetical protein [Streptomyces alkaliterrae]MQS02930.1 hypothetical protein [Streptomyces alkaliterrae]